MLRALPAHEGAAATGPLRQCQRRWPAGRGDRYRFAGISGHNDFSETLNAISEISKVSVIFRGDDKYFSFGPNKTWGLDPTLLKEEH